MVSTRHKIGLPLVLSMVILWSFFACGNSKTTVINQKEMVLDQHPRMVFLNYQVSKTSEGSISIQLINKIMTYGKVKAKPDINPSHDSDWECDQMDSSKNILQRTYIANPFQYQAEYINDNNELETRTIELDSAQISLRLQLYKNSKFVTLRSSKKNDTDKPIEITTTLDQP